MSIVRAPRPKSKFTTYSNDLIRNRALSFRARGVLMWILSQPDDWRTDAEKLAKEGAEGRDAIRAALRELKAAGYMVQTRRQDSHGRWVTDTMVYDTPQDVSAGQPGDGKPAVGDPDVGASDARRSTDTKNHDENWSDDIWATKPPAEQARRKPPKQPKPMTRDEMNADFGRLKALCLEVDQDDPVSVWWTLRKEHKAIHPAAFMARLVEFNEWDGFVGNHGIGEYLPNGDAA